MVRGTSGGSFSLMYHQSAMSLEPKKGTESQLDIDGMVYLINDNRAKDTHLDTSQIGGKTTKTV